MSSLDEQGRAAAAPAAERTADLDLTGRDVLTDLDLPLPDRRVGKVRISWALRGEPPRRLFVTTDRLSAFDRVMAAIPGKGQVLNQLSWWWFGITGDLVPNHALSLPDPNALVAIAATPLPVEVVVRGAITGVTSTSLWQRYAEGARVIDGHPLPEGLRKNELLPHAIITPTTKAVGGHDEPLSVADVVARGLVPASVWEATCAAALAVFARGQQRAAAAGLVLADTKYEFGIGPDGRLLLIDEVHTPDSSRYWVAASYEERLAAGIEPESLDKEPFRRALVEAGFTGEGPVPALGAAVWAQTAARYRDLYERITGEAFEPGATPIAERIVRNLEEEQLLCVA